MPAMKVKWRLALRSGSKVRGSGNLAGSKLPALLRHCTASPALRVTPCHSKSRVAVREELRIGWVRQEFFHRRVDQLGVGAEVVLNFGLDGHAAEHLADRGGDGVEAAEPEEPDDADFFLVGEGAAFDAAVHYLGDQVIVGVGLLFRDEAAQEIEHAAERGSGFGEVGGVQDVPFPREELLEHGGREAHQGHEDAHRIDAAEIPGDVDFAGRGEGFDHFDREGAHLRLHAVDRGGAEMREQELAVFGVVGRVDGERDGAECFADQGLEFGGALVREIVVVGVDAFDVGVMGDDPGAAAAAGQAGGAGDRGVVEDARDGRVGEPAAGLVGVAQVVGAGAGGPGEIDKPVPRDVCGSGEIDLDRGERAAGRRLVLHPGLYASGSRGGQAR